MVSEIKKICFRFQWSVVFSHADESPVFRALFLTFTFRRFGFANLQALEAGQTGTDCRGEEHEVTITWSVTSGKRSIQYDGREVHYSATRTSVIDHSWSSKGNHVIKVICHAAAPMSATPGFRQYEMTVDGQSFFVMPKVYELGIRGGVSSPSNASYGAPPMRSSPALRSPTTQSQEEADLQAAINASLAESRQHLSRHTSGASSASGPPADDLLSLPSTAPSVPYGSPPPAQFSSPPPPAQQFAPAPPPPAQQFAPAPPQPVPTPSYPPSNGVGSPALALPPSTNYGAPPPGPPPPQQQFQHGPPPPQQQFMSPPPPSYASPQPAQPDFGNVAHDPFAPKPPSQNDIANEILSAYKDSPGLTPTNANGNMNGVAAPGVTTPTLNGAPPPAVSPNGDAALSMQPLAIVEDEPENPFDAALKKLVNFDHIDEPAEEQLKLTMKEQEETQKQKNKNKSKPVPPAAHKMVGSGATLSQIKQVKPGKTAQKEVMKPPPQLFSGDAHMAGALVVHGSTDGGPPPLGPRGFGVNFPVNHSGAYAQQTFPGQQAAPPPQQQQPGYPPQPQQGYPPQPAQQYQQPQYQYR